MVLVITPSTMELASTPTGQINPLPFQFAAASVAGAQPEAGVDNCCNPFMAVLQRILQGVGCQSETAAAESGAKDEVSPEINGIPGVLFSSMAEDLADGSQTQAGTHFASNPAVMAAIQKIDHLTEGLTAPKKLAERLFSLLATLSGTKPETEAIQDPKGEKAMANDADNASQNSMKHAVLIALTQLLSQNGASRAKQDEVKSSGDNDPAGDVIDEDESWEELLPEIFSTLFTPDDTATIPRPLPALASEESISAEGEAPIEILSTTVKKVFKNQDLYGKGFAAPSHTQAKPETAEVVETELPSEEKIAPVPHDVVSLQTVPQSSDPMTGLIGIAAPPVAFNSPDNNESAGSKEGAQPPPSMTIADTDTATKPLGADRSTPTRAAVPSDETTNGIGQGEVRHSRRTPDHGSVEQIVSGPVDDILRGEDSAKTSRGLGSDVERHAKVLHSRLQAGDESQRTPVPGEQTAFQAAESVAAKSVAKTESLLAGTEPHIVKLASSPKSQSFAKGEGDYNSLAQGMAAHKAMEKGGANEPPSTLFGDIVADRIARMAEHIAQTDRSDLTLRLKIDGSDSVLLEMKERAGKMVIGIQCQDKTLLKALENQKDTMVRNLEMKNLHATISVSTIGEDEGNQQRRWHRERQEQRRENWGTRGERASAPYFEAVL